MARIDLKAWVVHRLSRCRKRLRPAARKGSAALLMSAAMMGMNAEPVAADLNESTVSGGDFFGNPADPYGDDVGEIVPYDDNIIGSLPDVDNGEGFEDDVDYLLFTGAPTDQNITVQYTTSNNGAFDSPLSILAYPDQDSLVGGLGPSPIFGSVSDSFVFQLPGGDDGNFLIEVRAPEDAGDVNFPSYTLRVSAVPEPTGLSLVGLALSAALVRRRRRLEGDGAEAEGL